jgi:A/G-specific adenine glycosylase
VATREDVAVLVEWFHAHKRTLPWRVELPNGERDPYRVWVSETMLQQTRSEVVAGYFERWVAQFPTVQSLASADEHAVLLAWSGLGYYNRARNLHKAAQKIVTDYGGKFPRTRAELEALPGIGPYTAGAILSIAFLQHAAILDGNLIRVFARLHEWEFASKLFWQEAQHWCEAGNPRDINEALMEIGATICKPKNPDCANCPLLDICKAGIAGSTDRFPARKSTQFKEWKGTAIIAQNSQGKILVVKDPKAPFLKNQWNFPIVPQNPVGASPCGCPSPTITHSITNHKINLSVSQIQAETYPTTAETAWLSLEEIPKYITSGLAKKILNSIHDLRLPLL